MFPPMVVQMMAVGEDTGALDAMLHKIAEFYDQEVEATTEALTALIEPLMIAVLGGIVGAHDHLALPADLQHLQAHQRLIHSVPAPGRAAMLPCPGLLLSGGTTGHSPLWADSPRQVR